jgi:hypothetical protein
VQLALAEHQPAVGVGRDVFEAAAMRDALARSEEVIDGLLTLARSDALTETEAVDLAGLVRASLEQQAAEVDAAGLGVELALEPAVVQGDRRLLGRATLQAKPAEKPRRRGGALDIVARPGRTCRRALC